MMAPVLPYHKYTRKRSAREEPSVMLSLGALALPYSSSCAACIVNEHDYSSTVQSAEPHGCVPCG